MPRMAGWCLIRHVDMCLALAVPLLRLTGCEPFVIERAKDRKEGLQSAARVQTFQCVYITVNNALIFCGYLGFNMQSVIAHEILLAWHQKKGGGGKTGSYQQINVIRRLLAQMGLAGPTGDLWRSFVPKLSNRCWQTGGTWICTNCIIVP